MKVGKSEKLIFKVYIYFVGFFFLNWFRDIYYMFICIKKLFIYMYLCNIEDYVEFYIIMRMDKFLKYLIYNLVVYWVYI